MVFVDIRAGCRRQAGAPGVYCALLFVRLFAAVVQLLINPGETSPMVGASGAISGVLGAYCYAFPRSRIKTLMLIWFWLRLVEIPAAVYLGFWFFMQVITGFSTIFSSDQTPVQVAFFAHVGGFICGLMIGYLTLDREAY